MDFNQVNVEVDGGNSLVQSDEAMDGQSVVVSQASDVSTENVVDMDSMILNGSNVVVRSLDECGGMEGVELIGIVEDGENVEGQEVYMSGSQASAIPQSSSPVVLEVDQDRMEVAVGDDGVEIVWVEQPAANAEMPRYSITLPPSSPLVVDMNNKVEAGGDKRQVELPASSRSTKESGESSTSEVKVDAMVVDGGAEQDKVVEQKVASKQRPVQNQHKDLVEAKIGSEIDSLEIKVEETQKQTSQIDKIKTKDNTAGVSEESVSTLSAPVASQKENSENVLPNECDLRKVKQNEEEEVTIAVEPSTARMSSPTKPIRATKMLPPPPPLRQVMVDPVTGQMISIVGSPSKSKFTRASPQSSPRSSLNPQDQMIPIPTPELALTEDTSEFQLLHDVSDLHSEEILVSSDEEDEGYKIQMRNASNLQQMKQSVDNSAARHRPRYVSRQLLHKKHPKCKGLSFKDIMHQTILEDKLIPDLNEQVLPQSIIYLLRRNGHEIHKYPDNTHMIFSKQKNIKMYHSSFSTRVEPVLVDPVQENYVQDYRKTLTVSMWKKRLEGGTKEVDPSSVIPASIGSTGSSSIGSETDPECLATDEEESESELMQGSVAAWIIPDAIVSRTPSPEPDYDEPQFIATTQVGSHTIVEGPPTKKRKQKHHEPKPHTDGKIYPKPAFSYSCLIAMALKNSKTGSLPVSEIYKFMCDHFPYFKSAPSGWKNSVRHNLSLNKCFEKIEKPGNNGARKGCLWALNPAKIHKMDEEVQKWSRKDPLAIRRAMSDPENLELIERGELKRDYSGAGGSDDDEDEDFSEPATPLTPAQLQARRSRTNSSDSTLEGATAVVTPVVTTVSQVHAALQRSLDPKNQVQMKREDSVELGTIANLQGNVNSSS